MGYFIKTFAPPSNSPYGSYGSLGSRGKPEMIVNSLIMNSLFSNVWIKPILGRVLN